MKKRILFLDDNPARHKRMRGFTLFDAAFTAEEAIEKLGKNQYDIVFLDHDLGGEEMVDSFSESPTGYTVAKWIAENLPKIRLIVLHSLNPAGRTNMRNVLTGVDGAGYLLAHQPFTTMSQDVVDELIRACDVAERLLDAPSPEA